MAARVTLYSRRGCHLCDDAREALSRVRATDPFELEVVDVDSDPDLAARFGHEVPVVYVGDRKVAKVRVDEGAFRDRLRREDAPA